MSIGSCEGLAIDPTNSDIVYAAGYPSFHRTLDGGNSWEQVTTGISGYTYAVVADVSDPNIVYAGGANGVFRSTNQGDDWTNIGLVGVNAVLIDPQNHDFLYAGTEGGVYMSMDAGTTWIAMSDGLEDLNVTSLGIFPECYLFCGTDIGGMYRWDISTGIEELMDHHVTHELRAEPNPMRNSATITYQLPTDSRVIVSIYDAQGRFLQELVNTRQAAGTYRQDWCGVDSYGVRVAAGVYFCRLTVGATTHFLKLVVTR
ncbi:MAG: T9SS type A sorting domain-containing protein [candidate division WOR-3 bacterium]|nr:MAG: T9SS type A sorting domain-containing protein [candidate division WOR-3 bacterium]